MVRITSTTSLTDVLPSTKKFLPHGPSRDQYCFGLAPFVAFQPFRACWLLPLVVLSWTPKDFPLGHAHNGACIGVDTLDSIAVLVMVQPKSRAMFMCLTINASREEIFHDLLILESFEVNIVYRSDVRDQSREYCEWHLQHPETTSERFSPRLINSNIREYVKGVKDNANAGNDTRYDAKHKLFAQFRVVKQVGQQNAARLSRSQAIIQ
jgi:hypothetical protein